MHRWSIKIDNWSCWTLWWIWLQWWVAADNQKANQDLNFFTINHDERRRWWVIVEGNESRWSISCEGWLTGNNCSKNYPIALRSILRRWWSSNTGTEWILLWVYRALDDQTEAMVKLIATSNVSLDPHRLYGEGLTREMFRWLVIKDAMSRLTTANHGVIHDNLMTQKALWVMNLTVI